MIVAGAVGAFLGDNTAYLIGKRASGWFHRRAERKPKFARKLAWAQMQILQRGGTAVDHRSFHPRRANVLTLSCGITRQNHWWFIRWVALAATIWATYAAMLGYVGGEAFEDDHTKAFLLAFGSGNRHEHRDRSHPPRPQEAPGRSCRSAGEAA